jgi:hypothetical protein
MESPVIRGKRALAVYLGLGETSAANLIRDGVIPSFTQAKRARAGMVRYVLRSDADEYLDRCREAALATASRIKADAE